MPGGERFGPAAPLFERVMDGVPPWLLVAVGALLGVVVLAMLLRRGDGLLWVTQVEFDGWSVIGRSRSLLGGSTYSGHIPLCQLSFVGTRRLHRPWFLALSLLALGAAMLLRDGSKDYLRTALFVASGVFVLAYFLLRKRTITFISSGGAGVGMDASPLRGGMTGCQQVVNEVLFALAQYEDGASHRSLDGSAEGLRARSLS